MQEAVSTAKKTGRFKQFIAGSRSDLKGRQGGDVFRRAAVLYRDTDEGDRSSVQAIGRATLHAGDVASSAASSAQGGAPAAASSELVPVLDHQAHALVQHVNGALQQAESLPWDAAKSIVRSTCLAVATACGEHARQEEAKLDQWINRQEPWSPPQGDALGPLVPVPRPPQAVRPLLRFEWQPPVIEMAERILKVIDEKAQQTSKEDRVVPGRTFREELREHWASRHHVTEHAKLPELGQIQETAYAASICRHAGFFSFARTVHYERSG